MSTRPLTGAPPAPTPAPAGPIALLREVRHRQPALALFGLALLALTIVSLGLQLVDARTIKDVSVWDKPGKFALSIAIFALTQAWLFGYVRPERRGSAPMRAVVAVALATGAFELGYITWQGGHGLESHFNTTRPFYAIMYALMGIGALSLVTTTLPLAWEIARRPAPGLRRDYVAAVVIGLVLCFVLGGGTGASLAANNSHSVGAVGGHLPVVGWNRLGGDLRAPHLLGVHAQQAVPILGALVARLPARRRWALVLAGSAGYAGLTLLLFAQAVAGRPVLPM